MKITIFAFLFLYIFVCSTVLSQQEDSTYQNIINNAPATVKEYYRLFDELVEPTQLELDVHKWPLRQIKKYASFIYDANEYDPIVMDNYDNLRFAKAREFNRNYVGDSHVIHELESRLSKKYAKLISHSYLMSVVVTDIDTLPFYLDEDPQSRFTEINIHAKITQVYKGEKFKIEDTVTCYYLTFWGYNKVVKGKQYIFALYPLREKRNPNIVLYALGGCNGVEESCYPIDNNYIIDENNIFELGHTVKLSDFIYELEFIISEIKQWKWE